MPRLARLVGEREALGLATARLRVVEQDRMCGNRRRGQAHADSEGRPRGVEGRAQTGDDGDRFNEMATVSDEQHALSDQSDERHAKTEQPGEARAHQAIQSGPDRDHHAAEHDQAARKLRHDDCDGQGQDRGRQDESGNRRNPLPRIQLAA